MSAWRDAEAVLREHLHAMLGGRCVHPDDGQRRDMLVDGVRLAALAVIFLVRKPEMQVSSRKAKAGGAGACTAVCTPLRAASLTYHEQKADCCCHSR